MAVSELVLKCEVSPELKRMYQELTESAAKFPERVTELIDRFLGGVECFSKAFVFDSHCVTAAGACNSFLKLEPSDLFLELMIAVRALDRHLDLIE